MRRLLTALALLFAVTGALAPAAQASWQWPVSGDVITPYRNGTDPYASGQHRGIDIAAPAGAAVRAATGGEVRFAGTAGSSGLTVSVRTGDGYDTSYLHLSSLSVRTGARVAAGDRLGAVGTTGTRSAAAPHLHFGVRTAESRHAYHDPLRFLQPPPAASRPPATPPAHAPKPVPAPPAGAPAPAPGAAPHPRTAPHPRGAPHPRPAPLGRRAPRQAPRPHPAPGPLPSPSPAGLPGGVPRGAPAPSHRPAIRGAPAPGHVPRPAPIPTPSSPDATAPHSPPGGSLAAIPAAPRLSRPASFASSAQPRSQPAGDHGPDVGWALACAGLLLAAGLLGLSEDGRRATRRSTRRAARRTSAALAR